MQKENFSLREENRLLKTNFETIEDSKKMENTSLNVLSGNLETLSHGGSIGALLPSSLDEQELILTDCNTVSRYILIYIIFQERVAYLGYTISSKTNI